MDPYLVCALQPCREKYVLIFVLIYCEKFIVEQYYVVKIIAYMYAQVIPSDNRI